jgi:hypothetical protein
VELTSFLTKEKLLSLKIMGGSLSSTDQGSRLKAFSLKGETALEDDGFSLSSAQASSSLSTSLDLCACLESLFGYLVGTM